MPFAPLQNQVVVCRIKGDAKNSSGLFIPNTSIGTSQEGEIVSVGATAKENRQRIAVQAKAGCRILPGKRPVTEIKFDGEDLMVMKESDIFGVMA